MHGRARGEQKELTEEEKQYVKEAKQLFDDCVRSIRIEREKGTFSQDTLKLTEKVLKINPEVATLWSFRKDYILSIQDDCETVDSVLNKELAFTESLFADELKSYNLWSSRAWLLEFVMNLKEPQQTLQEVARDYLKSLPDLQSLSCSPPLKDSLVKYDNIQIRLIVNELELCKRLFQIDDRNFHCWKHRSFVLCCLKRISCKLSWEGFCEELQLHELQFLGEMIETNFSNYSAWYQRTLLANDIHFNNIEHFKKELELVHTAIYTEPNDQSIWQYYSWLIEDFFPKALFREFQFSVCPSFYVKDVRITLPKDETEKDQFQIQLKLSLPCLFSPQNSLIVLETEDGSQITLRNGSWDPIYEDYSNAHTFVNSRLPPSFTQSQLRRTSSWVYSQTLGEGSPQSEVPGGLSKVLKSLQALTLNISVTHSGTVYSEKPLWKLEDVWFEAETFSPTAICPPTNLEDFRIFNFKISKLGQKQLSCNYDFRNYPVGSQLDNWREILEEEFNFLKTLQELENQCKYPILALKFIRDIYLLCLPQELHRPEKVSLESELLKQLKLLDPLRKQYYAETLNIE
ncbi:Geranylgeranyl transferase type-2 subunit alpha [Cryptosporidium felis]|nr:Geranylgeranyl transferase type-2 subunit alpha [Cryptosporidium felis]